MEPQLLKVKWFERPPASILFSGEGLEKYPKQKTGYLVCSHRSFFGKAFAVVKSDGRLIEVPLKWLKPYHTTYELVEEKMVT